MSWVNVLKNQELQHGVFSDTGFGEHLSDTASWIFDIKVDLQATETDGRSPWTKEEKSKFYEEIQEWMDLAKHLDGLMQRNPEAFGEPEKFPNFEKNLDRMDMLMDNFVKLQAKYNPHNLGDA